MGILSWILMGLIAGLPAKFFMPGKDPGGIIIIVQSGIAGSLSGGFIGSHPGIGSKTGLNLKSILIPIPVLL